MVYKKRIMLNYSNIFKGMEKYESKKENSLAVLYPDLIDDWDYEQNGNLTPYNVSWGSVKKVWWKCKNCEHKWYTSIYIRTKCGSKCPNCRGKNNGESYVYV